jgi:uncharacterized protein (TIGR00303 family)
MTHEPILFSTAPERGRAFVERWRGVRPTFYCVLGHTDTCLISGVSTAGVTEDLRAYTPAADAEVVNLGVALCLPTLPSSPLGAPGPAGITRAALGLAGIEAHFVGAGLRVWPETNVSRMSEQPGANIETGHAVPDAQRLFEAGVALGREVAARSTYLVLGESVPGGTTTALAVLLALGYAAEGRVSGSMPGNAHELKTRIARSALHAAGLERGDGLADPLMALGAVGDPMQPLAAGIALGASGEGCEVLLAGGSQMLAVAAVLRAVDGSGALARITIGTTRWIVEDPAADVVGLAEEISSELAVLAVNLDFSDSAEPGLRGYERFLVKEGVGAGGACIAALLGSGASLEELHARIDATYAELLGRLTSVDSPDSRRR